MVSGPLRSHGFGVGSTERAIELPLAFGGGSDDHFREKHRG